MEPKYKNALIGALLAIVFVMAIGYAAFAQQLTINGNASITSSWNIHILSITPSVNATSTTENNKTIYTTAGSTSATVSNDRLSANFSTVLLSPSDKVTYTVVVENSGTINAKVGDAGVIFSDQTQMSSYSENEENNAATDAIIYTYSGIAPGTTIAANGGKNTFTIDVIYNPKITSQPAAEQLTKNLTMTLNYVQAA